MLTRYQAEIIGHIGDGEVLCLECADRTDDATVPISRYAAEDEWPGGLWCDACGEELVEPDEEYCLVHEAWAEEYDSKGRPSRCTSGQPNRVYVRADEPCRFPGLL